MPSFVTSGPLLLTLIGMILGLLGTFLPILPGLPIIVLCAALYYTFVTGWSAAPIAIVVVMSLLALAAMSTHYWLGPARTVQSGASRSTSILAALAGIIGLFVLPLVGAILLPLAVVLVIEYLRVRDVAHAWRATWAYFVGWLMSTGLQVLAGLLMIALFWVEAAY